MLLVMEISNTVRTYKTLDLARGRFVVAAQGL